MHQTMTRTAVTAALTIFATTALADVSRITTPPTLDGKLDEAVWAQAKWETGFKRYRESHTGREPTVQTSFALLADAENLYFGAKCPHRQMAWLRKHDASLWTAEAVELYVAPTGNTFDFYQFLMTYQGHRHAIFYSESGNIRPDPYQSEWECKVSDTDAGWTLEARIPLAAFYMTRNGAWSTDWKVNVSRSYFEENGHDFNCWIDGNGFRDLANYRTVSGFPTRRLEEDVWVKNVEAVTKGLTADKRIEGSMKLVVRAAKGGPATLETPFSGRTQVALNAGDTEIVVPATFPENGRLPTLVKLTRAGETAPLVRTYPMRVDYQALRTKITKPAYRNNFYPGQCSDEVAGRVVSAVPGPVEVVLEGPGFATRKATLAAGGGDFSFDTKGFGEGTATLTVRAAKDVQTVKIRKILRNPSGGSVSWIENGHLVVDGKPVFRRSMYADGYMGGVVFRSKYLSGLYDLHLTPEVGGCGTFEPGRLIRGIENKEAVKDVVPCKEIFAKMDKIIDAALARTTKGGVYYYISDEPECRGVSPVYLKYMYDYACDRDPYHVILCGSRAGERYLDCADWFETHPYLNARDGADGKRVYSQPFNTLGSFVDEFRPERHPDKCVGCMPTCFAYAPNAYATFREYVTHTWNFLIHGVKSFYPYAYHDLGDTAVLYRGVKFTNENAERLSDFFLLGTRTLLRADAEIEAALWEREGEKLFAVVNMTDRPQTVTLEGVTGDFREFRGARTYASGWFGSSVTVELAPLEAIAAATARYDEGLQSYEAAAAEVAALEKVRLGRDNQLLNHPYDVAMTSSTKSTRFRKLCDGTRDVIAWTDRFGKDKFVALAFDKVHPKFQQVVVFGVNLEGVTVQVSADGQTWSQARVVKTEPEDNGVRLTLAAVLEPKALRLSFPKNEVELYEIELPRP